MISHYRYEIHSVSLTMSKMYLDMFQNSLTLTYSKVTRSNLTILFNTISNVYLCQQCIVGWSINLSQIYVLDGCSYKKYRSGGLWPHSLGFKVLYCIVLYCNFYLNTVDPSSKLLISNDAKQVWLKQRKYNHTHTQRKYLLNAFNLIRS